ncbi:hypothetical protein LMJF_34_2040 [Leishmania major strain Friedlin]|uniref:Uncharacterized protein n=1 Tax=Leishmania major TaxID=5664 RepID=Q4Q2Z7_LEIMA|nr:hypothetical protein LMJF_34_2040 [Leishmania major strain Friedlin]CAG9582074.1 hypothetical_protein_-_conserved [Leishmania major strain Friedlin]CAJ07916.1 hypothetical protein LMJF_34_2040 [Leishmania major strain Friedlin]|eukprot:XP_001686301.1 hypothetical protein LMJF_34_2040 [Leishmania major strain Friedlin]
MQGSSTCFATPPRRHNASLSAEAELTVLTAGISLAHEEMCTRKVGGTVFNRTPADGAPRYKSNSSLTAVAVLSVDLSPRQRRGGTSFASGILAECDSPCGSPRVHLTRPFSSRGSFAKPVLCGSLPSTGAPSLKAADGALANRSSSGLHGVSPSISVTPSEAEEDVTATSAESVFATASMEPLVTPGSIVLTANDARPSSSPSFTYFPSGGGGVPQESSASTIDKANTVGSATAFRLSSVPGMCDGCGAIKNNNSSIEHKCFEPLQLDASCHLFSPLQRFSSVHTSQRASCVPTLEPCAFNCGGAPVDHKDVTLACPLSSVQHGKLCEIVKQQLLLHACLVSIAREREDGEDLQRRAKSTLEKAQLQQRQRRCTRLLSIMCLLWSVFLRLPLRILKRALTTSAGKLWKLLLLTQES